MNKLITFSLLFHLIVTVSAQEISKFYINKSNVNSSAGWCYQVTEIEIRADSTYKMTSYGCGSKKDVRNYTTWDMETDSGSVLKHEDYFILTQIRNGIKDQQWTVSINNQRINFYHPLESGKMQKIISYPRNRKKE